MDRTLLWQAKQTYLAQCLAHTTHVLGLTAEIGVYLGGTSAYIANHNENKPHLAADTYGVGIVHAGSKDQHVNGEFTVDRTEVINYLRTIPNIIPIVGIFPESFTSIEATFSFVHVDLDTYQGTIDSLTYFWDRLNTGACLLYDDWQWGNCVGVTTALQEFLKENPKVAWSEGSNQLALWKT
jgi:hypothetical protein